MNEKQVKDVMTERVISVKRKTTVGELCEILLKNNITGVPVVDEDNRLEGMVTDADIITENIEPIFPIYFDPLIASFAYMDDFKKYTMDVKEYLSTKVEDIMTRRVKSVKPETLLSDAIKIMVKDRLNRIPVVDSENRVTGIIARADVLRSLVSDAAKN
ncbi:MAG: CBS domain-containing protein [Actinobacteria bacterium]|nr:CBS domain-containing protein [Actinomycetota bacterium]